MNNLRDDILQNVILVCCGIALQNFRSMVRSLSVNDSSLVDFNVLGLILVTFGQFGICLKCSRKLIINWSNKKTPAATPS